MFNGVFEISAGDEPTQPFEIRVRIIDYNRMLGDSEFSPASRIDEINAWCVERGWRVEVRESDDMAAIDAGFKSLKTRYGATEDGGIKYDDGLIEEIESMLLKNRSNSMFFPSETAAFEFKVRWL